MKNVININLFSKKIKNTNCLYWELPVTNELVVEVALFIMKERFGCDIKKYDIYSYFFDDIKPKFKNRLFIILDEDKLWFWADNYKKVKNHIFKDNIIVTKDDIKNFEISKETSNYNL